MHLTPLGVYKSFKNLVINWVNEVSLSPLHLKFLWWIFLKFTLWIWLITLNTNIIFELLFICKLPTEGCFWLGNPCFDFDFQTSVHFSKMECNLSNPNPNSFLDFKLYGKIAKYKDKRLISSSKEHWVKLLSWPEQIRLWQTCCNVYHWLMPHFQ